MAEAVICDNKACNQATPVSGILNWLFIETKLSRMGEHWTTLNGTTFCSEKCLLDHLTIRLHSRETAKSE